MKTVVLPDGRTAYYVDVGNIPPEKTLNFIEKVRKIFNEQKLHR